MFTHWWPSDHSHGVLTEGMCDPRWGLWGLCESYPICMGQDYVCGETTHKKIRKKEEYMRGSLVFRNSRFTVFTLYRPVPVCLFTPARFTLPGAPGASSDVYLVITPIHQDEHGGEVGLPGELIAGHTDQAKSQWAAGEVAAVISFQSAIPTQQRPDLPLVFQPCTSCLSSQHLSRTRKD